jgi:hypothetical protein
MFLQSLVLKKEIVQSQGERTMATRRSLLAAGLGTGMSAILGKIVGPPRGIQPAVAALGTAGSASGHTAETSGPVKLLAHWKMDGHCRDSAGSHHGEQNNIQFVPGHDGHPEGAAKFDGKNSVVEVADHEDFHFDTREFSIAVWVNTPQDLDSVIGDVFSKYDPHRRRGVNLSICGSSPGYSGIGDAKNVQFGIDNGVNESWTDCGRPSKNNPLICALAVYKGNLYAGIASASMPENACHVYRYAGGHDWVDCGRLGNDPLTVSAYSMIVHKGDLYAGTGTYDWDKARGGIGGPSHVYRYQGGKEWEDCGEFSKGFRTTSLASYKGRLYAGDDYAACYRYEGNGKWSSCGRLGTDWNVERMFNTTAVFQGDLYAASLPGIYRYAGESTWESIGQRPFGTTQVHKLQIYDRHLWAGTWPFGKVLRYEGQNDWTDRGQLGIEVDKVQINEVNDLTVFNGKLYAGVIPKGEVYRYENGTEWTRLRSLLLAPNYSPKDIASWSRVPCMAPFRGRLFMGTGMCEGRYYSDMPVEAGRVYAMDAGRSVSYDEDLGSGWKHLAAVRGRNTLELYVNGQLVATSSAFDSSDYDVSTFMPLRIGLGEQNNFLGSLDDFRVYQGALSAAQVKDLSKRKGERSGL